MNIDDMADILGQSEILEPDAKKWRNSARQKRKKNWFSAKQKELHGICNSLFSKLLEIIPLFLPVPPRPSVYSPAHHISVWAIP